MNELTLEATLENLEKVQSFVEDKLDATGCSMKIKMQISIAVEEIYVNIAHYAYNPGVGNATIKCTVDGDPLQVSIQFMDSGIPFNPLAKEDADTTLSVDEREIGGLGIYMVKKSMDEITYEYKDGKNILKIKKKM